MSLGALDRLSTHLWAQGSGQSAVETATGGQNYPVRKSLIPPARPKAEAKPQRPRPQPSSPITVDPWFETDGHRYFLSDDADMWPTAVHGFAVGVKAKFDDFRYSRIGRLDFELEEVWDHVEGRLQAVNDERDNLSPYDEDNLAMAFIEEYLLENVAGLAIDENGNYFIMYLANNPDDADWLPTGINVNPAASVSQQTYGGGWQPSPMVNPPTESDGRRHKAALEAWRAGND
jgi:hypothetical protein